ncbi:acyl-coenzyme A thioesterase 6-like isoform X2 [Pungitius pungitius]|uniref:acyl-coenzyme A thioesterase 6-like isoform X2 n=1 Tax=Pungitius pungitius TaxID=134920 RepID=UPI002E100688
MRFIEPPAERIQSPPELWGSCRALSTGADLLATCLKPVADDFSFGGTYIGKEAMGLLWSMRSVPGSCKGLRLRKTNVCTPQLVHISVYDGHVEEGFTERPPLASVLSERWFIGPGVRRVEVQEKGVRGTLFIPPGPGPFPGMMDMWGVRGGLVEYRSAPLASHGYASRALQYFAAGELSSASKEFEYFEDFHPKERVQSGFKVRRRALGQLQSSLSRRGPAGDVSQTSAKDPRTLVTRVAFCSSAQTLLHHVLVRPPNPLRRPLSGPGGRDLPGEGAESASELRGDPSLPPPLRGRGPVGGLWTLRQRPAGKLADDFSIGGTYIGKEAMGLLWSMRPVPGSRKGLRLRKKNVCTPQLVHISVYDGHVEEGFTERPPLASVLSERWFMDPGVRRVEVQEKGVRGTLFIPPGPGPFPGVMDMWGGGGGLVEYRSALLASHGYASLALQYFAAGELSSASKEFEYFETAFNAIRLHPLVSPDRVGILGFCLGAIITNHLAAESTVIKPRCCVCVSGVHICPRGALLTGIYQTMVANTHKVQVDENNHEIWRYRLLPIPDNPAKKIDVGKINCPMLLVNGLDDHNMPAVEAAEDMAHMMRAAGKDHLLTRIEYPATGHLIEPPYSPHFRATNFKKSAREKVILLLGGQTKAHSDAQEDSWKKILAFLQQHLYSNDPTRAKM